MSLRTRLVLAVGLVALLALAAADIATYKALQSFLSNRIDQTLTATACGPPRPGPHDGGGASVAADSTRCGFDFGGPLPPSNKFADVFAEQRQADGTGASVPAYVEGKFYSPAISAGVLGTNTKSTVATSTFLTTPSTPAGGPEFRVLVVTYPSGDQLILGQPLDATEATLHDLLLIELAVTGAALIAAVLIGVWLVRVGLRPLRQVEATAEAIANGELERRVPGEEKRTEVGRLARVLNVMLARIQRAFQERDATEAQLRSSEERLRRFISDASHELRTPLAAVSAYAELYSQGASEHPEDLARVMQGIQGESARMKGLVEDLLLLARLDEGRPLHCEPVELVALSADAIHAAMVVGPEWPVALEADHPVEVSADPERLRQVLDNLLANVRAHTPRGTTTVVRIIGNSDHATLEVLDNGPGLSVEESAHLFERFYRADPSRSRNSGGAGLGLSIVEAIVAAHGGTVSVSAGTPRGAVFTVVLPSLAEERYDTSEDPSGSPAPL